MQEIIKIDYQTTRPTVLGRDLHNALEVKTKYIDWFKRMCEYGFVENTDFIAISQKWETAQGNVTTQTNHQFTIPMAKEICMLQRNEKGRMFRQYFIQVEENWNSPEMIVKRALEITNAKVEKLTQENRQLKDNMTELAIKADYCDWLTDRSGLTGFRETALELGVGQTEFINFLIDRKYIYRNKKGILLPYSTNKDLFKVKQVYNEETNWSGTQTFVTAKGREYFNGLINNPKAMLSGRTAVALDKPKTAKYKIEYIDLSASEVYSHQDSLVIEYIVAHLGTAEGRSKQGRRELNWDGYEVNPWQVLTTVSNIIKGCGQKNLTYRMIETSLRRLKDGQFISEKSSNVGRLITVIESENFILKEC